MMLHQNHQLIIAITLYLHSLDLRSNENNDFTIDHRPGVGIGGAPFIWHLKFVDK
jgi:hypothetical protein